MSNEQNHYYAFGLKIAGISSAKFGDEKEGSLKMIACTTIRNCGMMQILTGMITVLEIMILR